jgi:hypothetical protein
MNADDIDASWVRAAARLQGLELEDDQLPGVMANFRRTVRIADLVIALALDEQDDELGPVWRP